MEEIKKNHKNKHPELYERKLECEICGNCYWYSSKSLHLKSKKHLEAIKNKNIYEEVAKIKILEKEINEKLEELKKLRLLEKMLPKNKL